MRAFLFFIFSFLFLKASAQFAPQAGLPGSTAIPASSEEFIGWATHCTIQRGYMDIANPSLGYASAGDSSLATGPADNSIVSLGDSGTAVLTFAAPIYNGPGADFAVFENGFINTANPAQAFLELGFVEVSSDGVNYFRFPATSLTQTNTQIGNGDYIDASGLNNLAGKYIGMYGTPFDLQELSGIAGLDINSITHVRIVDVVGSISGHSSHDSAGRVINDPYPTPFASCGFDLDAVGAIHQVATAANNLADNITVNVYPNPADDKIMVFVKGALPDGLIATLSTITGNVLQRLPLLQNTNTVPVSIYPAGMYYLLLSDANGNKWVEKVTKH